jgi:hypothetical protein
MSSVNFGNLSNAASLFQNSSSSSLGSTSFLSDYASIKNGSYFKLLKSYYGGNEKAGNMLESSNLSTATAKDTARKLTSLEQGAEGLKSAANALVDTGKNSVFNKVEKKGEDGKTTKEYDVDAIYNKVNEFVNGYNDVIEASEDVNSSAIAKSVDSMSDASIGQSKRLAEIGISINGDGTLSLNKETFTKSNMETVKNLFNGHSSYGYQTAAKASKVDYYAQNEAKKANTYNQLGQFSNNNSVSFNNYF